MIIKKQLLMFLIIIINIPFSINNTIPLKNTILPEHRKYPIINNKFFKTMSLSELVNIKKITPFSTHQPLKKNLILTNTVYSFVPIFQKIINFIISIFLLISFNGIFFMSFEKFFDGYLICSLNIICNLIISLYIYKNINFFKKDLDTIKSLLWIINIMYLLFLIFLIYYFSEGKDNKKYILYNMFLFDSKLIINQYDFESSIMCLIAFLLMQIILIIIYVNEMVQKQYLIYYKFSEEILKNNVYLELIPCGIKFSPNPIPQINKNHLLMEFQLLDMCLIINNYYIISEKKKK